LAEEPHEVLRYFEAFFRNESAVMKLIVLLSAPQMG
jgi:hypothetical protein